MNSFARRFGNARVALLMAPVAVTAALLIAHGSQAKDVKSLDAEDTSAERLVAEARQAEIAGDTEKCYRLLRDAVRVSPDSELARWQLGQMEVDGQWLSVEEAQRRAAANPKQAEYRELRAQWGETPVGQLELARWCRKNGLTEEARFHWSSVLEFDPTNAEALRATNKRWSGGQLLTHEQIERQKESVRESKRLARKWAPTVAKWRKAISGGPSLARDEALSEIRALTDVGVISQLEKITLAGDPATAKPSDDNKLISAAFIDALTRLDDQKATESLVRHAVLSPLPNVYATATAELKNRRLHDYVPILLDGLAMPVTSSFNVETDRDGSVHYFHSLYREGAQADWAVEADYSTWHHVLPGRRYVWRQQAKVLEDQTDSPLVQSARIANTVHRETNNYTLVAATLEAQVAQMNQTASTLNSRIMPVLANTTGQDFTTAKQWWDWWRDTNEYYAADHPVNRQYYNGNNNYYYGQPTDTYSINPSCFTKGTPIWTKTGQRPVETLQLGDLVLAQNVDTGELSYKPVIGRTVRPPSQIVGVKFDREEIQTTLGHPFWVAGTGWQMAKELKVGAVLHGMNSSTRIRATKQLDQQEAYNLVVADFNTYFVGETGVLVHDNTPRTPTRAKVPGLAAK